MARLTRKFLKALNIEDDNIQDQIVNAHAETVDALKEQRDEYKEAFDELPKVKEALEKAQKDLEGYKSGDDPLKSDYEELKKNFDNYKNEVENEKLLSKKKAAYVKMLKEIPIVDNAIDGIVKITNFDEIELDGDDIKNVDKVKENAEKQWGGFKVTTVVKGAQTEMPPQNTGGSTKTKEEILKIKDPIERQKAIAENKEAFNI